MNEMKNIFVKHTKKSLLILLTLTIGFSSCSDDFFRIKPKGQADISSFNTLSGAESLLIGAYAAVDGSVTDNSVSSYASSVSNWIWGSVASDDAYKGRGPSSQFPINAIEQHTLDPFNSYLENHWRNLYDGVVRTNDVLGVVNEISGEADEARCRLIEAQAKFLRAHFYFELTKVHGKVPYIDESTENPSHVPNDHLLWPEIEADLKYAADNLPSRWSDKGRATKWAAKTYLAQIYMFQNKFKEAIPLLEDVYTNGGFSLMPSYEQNYLIDYNNNAESIFEIQYVTNDFPGSPNAMHGDAGSFPSGDAGMGTCCGYFTGSHSLVSAYRVSPEGLPLLEDEYTTEDILPYSKTGESVPYKNPVDPRLDHTVGRPGIPFLDWGIHPGEAWVGSLIDGGPYLYKKHMFKKSEQGLTTETGWAGGLNPNNFRKFRLGHVILWLAECKAETGELMEATRLVNEIRNRAKQTEVVKFDDGTPAANYLIEPYPNTFPSKEYALKAIRHEIRLEFAMEGLRFFDLVRWGIAAEVLNNYLSVDGTIMPHLSGRVFTKGQHEVAPIPQREIDLSQKDGSSVLVQNTGY